MKGEKNPVNLEYRDGMQKKNGYDMGYTKYGLRTTQIFSTLITLANHTVPILLLRWDI